MALSERSRSRLQGVHPDLIRVVERASEIGPPFIVTEGLRSKERQRELVKRGASRTMNSRHITGHAVDIADVKATYAVQEMTPIAAAMKQAAKDCNVPIEWGGDWKSFCDMPHWQLTWKKYPGSGVTITEKVSQAAKVAASARVITGAGVGATAVAASPETVQEASKVVVETVSAIPAPPAAITESVTNVQAWKGIGDQIWTLQQSALAHPSWAAGLGLGLLIIWKWEWVASKVRGRT